jgi:hypothetical protein
VKPRALRITAGIVFAASVALWFLLTPQGLCQAGSGHGAGCHLTNTGAAAARLVVGIAGLVATIVLLILAAAKDQEA